MTKNQEMNIKFWMQECDKTGVALEGTTAIDLEAYDDFEGITYCEAKGLLDKGKIKNVYQEQYADSDRLRVHFPSTPTREATKVTFTFVFVGENRQQSYENFYDFITGGYRIYWDNKRKKRLVFYAPNEYSPAEEAWHGSTPYLKMNIEVQNIFGDTTDFEKTGTTL